ncbi:MAG: aminoacyl-tRNA hydrolase [Betaproteobacteria bacterium]|nr:aminoacyl-tRNA hydrolase [Betaproteobacteria bacterium]MDE2621684.1 aminoacyl-tRNA hydrolase [Betaproteobacteria bacterium]
MTTSPLQLIVGLGNPGADYQHTRHNAGFWFVDRVAQAAGQAFRHESRFHGEVAKVLLDGRVLWLLKPGTYMNASGRAVAALTHFHRFTPDQVLVVHDELDLPPGVAKVKRGGGAAGHNGLKDLIAALGSPEFWRLRIGIGHPGQRDAVADFVLHRPSRSEQDAIDEALERALGVLPELVSGQAAAAMMNLHAAPGKGAAANKG